MVVAQAFAHAVAADFREMPEEPGGGEGLVHGEQMEWPRDGVVQGAVPLELDVHGKLAVGHGKEVPGPGDSGGVGVPVRPSQLLQEGHGVGGERLEGEFAGGLVHQAGVVAEIPALHGGVHVVGSHEAVFFVEVFGDGQEGDGGVLVGASHLEFGAHVPGVPADVRKEFGGADEGQGVVEDNARFAQLARLCAGLEVEHDGGVVRPAPGDASEPLAEVAVVALRWRVEPSDVNGVRIDAVDFVGEDLRGFEEDVHVVPLRAQRALPGIPSACGGVVCDARAVVLPQHDVDDSAQPGDRLEDPPDGFPDVLFSRVGGETDMAGLVQVGVGGGLFRMDVIAVCADALGLAEEDIDSDAVSGAALHGLVQLGEADFGLSAVCREEGGGQVLEIHGEPEAVDALVGQPVQVFLRIVVDVVGQLVDEEGRARGGAEEASGDAVPHERSPTPMAGHGGGAFRLAQAVLQKVDASPEAITVRGGQADSLWGDLDQVLLSFQRLVLHEAGREAVRRLADVLVGQNSAQGVEGRRGELLRLGESDVQPNAVREGIAHLARIAAASRREVVLRSFAQFRQESGALPGRLRDLCVVVDVLFVHEMFLIADTDRSRQG